MNRVVEIYKYIIRHLVCSNLMTVTTALCLIYPIAKICDASNEPRVSLSFLFLSCSIMLITMQQY